MNPRCLPWWRRKPTVCLDDCGADLHSLALLSPEERFGLPRWLRGRGSACPAGDTCPSPGSGNSLEKEMATHSSLLAWRVPRTEEPGGLQSMGLHRVRQDWATSTHETCVMWKTWKAELCVCVRSLSGAHLVTCGARPSLQHLTHSFCFLEKSFFVCFIRFLFIMKNLKHS